MKLLLDTHVLLWWLDNPKQLDAIADQAICDLHNDVFVSAVVGWEIGIKSGLGKLTVPSNLMSGVTANGLIPLPVTLEHGLSVQNLPMHHRDPFDRLLVAQAIAEGMTLVTRDAIISQYGVPTLPA